MNTPCKRTARFLRAIYFIEAFLVLRESEDDETPQRTFFVSEEAHREPAESVVYFLSSGCMSQFIDIVSKTTPLLAGRVAENVSDGTSNRCPNPKTRSEEHTSELQSRGHLVCRLLLEKKKDDDPRLA